jgi:hypothetical protein
MTNFRPGNRVRINWPGNENLHERTGTVADERPAFLDPYFAVRLDKPLDDGTDHVDVAAECLERLQVLGADTTHLWVDGLIQAWDADGAATVAAVHIRTGLVIDIVCSRCGPLSADKYVPGTTDVELEQLRDQARTEAFIHASTCYAPDPDATDRG